MKLLVPFLILSLSICVFSCSHTKEKKKIISSLTVIDSVITGCNSFVSDSAKSIGTKGLFMPDDYPVTYGMLRNTYFTTKQIGKLFAGDQAWFANDSIKQGLIIEIATDLHRFKLFNFAYNEFPDKLLNEINIYKHEEGHVDSMEIKSVLPLLIDSAKKISSLYFITQKGFKLGDCKGKALQVYGNPHEQYQLNDIEELKWIFEGDEQFTDEKQKPPANKLIAQNSFGHTVTMYFRKERLIGLVLFNDIP